MPTRDQLLREAGEKESLAATFTRYARSLPEAFEGIPAAQGDHAAFWTGPAAERYLTQALRLRRELAELADSCLATAENLRRRARRLRQDAAEVPELA
ncbi:hypothetical protein AB0I81_12640 [Nonomuraea sp. NPDC050404]|uniref:hypothetical protein n=1 Tax=Nonomuraea sp. NPDC050404 TaxID=3155783 RepID=UPI0033E48FF1